MPARRPCDRPLTRGRVACWLCFLCALPSVAWRLAMLAGVDTGFQLAQTYRSNPLAAGYVLGLEAVQVTAAVLCLGLGYAWGERVPRWVPRIGGRAVPRWLPIVAGGAGNALLYVIVYGVTVLFALRWLGLAQGFTPTPGMSPAQVAALALAYAPMLAWPPALTVALIGYWRRTGSARAPAEPAAAGGSVRTV